MSSKFYGAIQGRVEVLRNQQMFLRFYQLPALLSLYGAL